MTVKSVHAKLIGHAHKDIGKDHAASASNTTLLVQRIDVFQRQQALGALTLHGQRKHARYDRVHSSKYTRDGAGSSAPAAICRERCRKINKHARRGRAQLASQINSAPEPMATGKVKASRLRDDESRSIRTGIICASLTASHLTRIMSQEPRLPYAGIYRCMGWHREIGIVAGPRLTATRTSYARGAFFKRDHPVRRLTRKYKEYRLATEWAYLFDLQA